MTFANSTKILQSNFLQEKCELMKAQGDPDACIDPNRNLMKETIQCKLDNGTLIPLKYCEEHAKTISIDDPNIAKTNYESATNYWEYLSSVDSNMEKETTWYSHKKCNDIRYKPICTGKLVITADVGQ